MAADLENQMQNQTYFVSRSSSSYVFFWSCEELESSANLGWKVKSIVTVKNVWRVFYKVFLLWGGVLLCSGLYW